MLLTLSGRSFIKIQNLPHSNILQYYVKLEKCKVNDVIFPSGCEARAINLGNKNMKIGIFIGCTSVRSKNIFIDISRYPTGKHEIKHDSVCSFNRLSDDKISDWFKILPSAQIKKK